jgi:DNA-directed RNA polymerase subunit RPC12/RpoP
MYCLRCRKKVEVEDEKIELTNTNKRKLLRAKCPECNAGLAKFTK